MASRHKYVVAFDSFKGCLSAQRACEAAREGLAEADSAAEVVTVPVSDGGEGFAQCLAAVLRLEERTARVSDPLGRPVDAHFYVDGSSTAYLDVASACGLGLLAPEERDAVAASSRGAGELILAALESGCRRIVVGLGGSATTDCGKDLLDALQRPLSLSKGPSKGVEIIAATDVKAPLYGPEGAAYVFSPQKGATLEQVEFLDNRLRQYSLELESRYGIDPGMVNLPGAGAAGGIGYALSAVLGAKLVSGIDLFLQLVDFDSILEGATAVITGEGSSDSQTLLGKAPVGVLNAALRHSVPVHLLSGQIKEADRLLSAGFASVSSINEGCILSPDELLRPEIALANLRAASSVIA